MPRHLRGIGVAGSPNALPNVIITNVTWSPASPISSDHVVFTATVKNVGTVATPSGVIIGVAFSINSTKVTFSDNVLGPLNPGASVNCTATGGGPANVNYWTPGSSGTFNLVAQVDDINRFAKDPSDVTTYSATVTVVPTVGTSRVLGVGFLTEVFSAPSTSPRFLLYEDYLGRQVLNASTQTVTTSSITSRIGQYPTCTARAGWQRMIWDLTTPNGFGTDFTVTQIAAGSADAGYTTIFNAIIAALHSGALHGEQCIRFLKEMGGNGWYPWQAQTQTATNLINAYRHVHDLGNSLCAAASPPVPAFTWDWNFIVNNNFFTPDSYYPGDAYVTYITGDVYDAPNYGASQAAGTPGTSIGWNSQTAATYANTWTNVTLPLLTQLLNLGVAHGKMIGFPEMGVEFLDNGGAPGDNNTYMTDFVNWVNAHIANIAYVCDYEFRSQQSTSQAHTYEGVFKAAGSGIGVGVYGFNGVVDPWVALSGGTWRTWALSLT